MSKYFFLLILIFIFSLACNQAEKVKKYDNDNKVKQKISCACSDQSLLHKEEKKEKNIVKKLKEKLTFIELGSKKCIPCKMMVPVMEKIKKKYPKQVKVVFYDVWTEEGKSYGKQYGIRIIPTQIFLDSNNKIVFRHEGFFSFEEIEKIFQKNGIK